MNRSSSKHIRIVSPIKSPVRTDPSYYETLERTSQYKLNEKIHKLKHALKAAEKHNEQLHGKVKYYKEHCGQSAKLEEDVRKYRKKYEAIHCQFDKKILENQELKIKLDSQTKNNHVKGKQNYQTKIRELHIQITAKDMKITHLETINKDLQQAIQERNQTIKQLQMTSQAHKLREIDEKSSKINKLQQQLQIKIAESHQHSRQIGKLKDSLRDSLAKLEKANGLVSEQSQKNKYLNEQHKQLKKLLVVIQKQTSTLRQGSEKIKLQNLQKVQKINKLERQKMSMEYEMERQRQKLDEVQEKYKKIQIELERRNKEYMELQLKHQQTLGFHYDAQREFERQLHTIVKELTRRHIVSKSIIGSMGSSGIYSMGSPIKNQESMQRHGVD